MRKHQMIYTITHTYYISSQLSGCNYHDNATPRPRAALKKPLAV